MRKESDKPNPLVLGRPAGPFSPFRARPPWIGGDLQTVRNNLIHNTPDLSRYAETQLVLKMNDGTGDALNAVLNKPRKECGKPLIVLIHGLTGSALSRNILTSAAYFLSLDYPVLRLNLRGVGSAPGACARQYHAGKSEDLREVLANLPEALTARGIYLVGVSLGGNMLLKFLGENTGCQRVLAAAAVSSPIDLKAAQMRIMAPRNTFYHGHLLNSMKSDVLRAASRDDTLVISVLEHIHTIYDFDDRIVAPRNGFAGAEDYYRRCSARGYLARINVPCLIIHARNDPWVPARSYLAYPWQSDGLLTVLLPPGGGHVGFHGAGDIVPWHDRCTATFFRLTSHLK